MYYLIPITILGIITIPILQMENLRSRVQARVPLDSRIHASLHCHPSSPDVGGTNAPKNGQMALQSQPPALPQPSGRGLCVCGLGVRVGRRGQVIRGSKSEVSHSQVDWEGYWTRILVLALTPSCMAEAKSLPNWHL